MPRPVCSEGFCSTSRPRLPRFEALELGENLLTESALPCLNGQAFLQHSSGPERVCSRNQHLVSEVVPLV